MNYDGSGIPQKCRMQQKHDKHPGPLKVWTNAEIRELEIQQSSLEKDRENVQINSTIKMPEHIKRHCGPNFRRFSFAQLSQIKGKVGNKEIPNIGEKLFRI